MNKARLLWVDDEIDLLKPYVLFLEEKGYATQCVNNGRDAIELCRSQLFDIVFLDEQMPGLTGLETLAALHSSHPEMPVVMVTKSEDEGIMNKAIGKKITDYLIKPVNPNQVLMSIKKILEKDVHMTETVTQEYRELFNTLIAEMEGCRTAGDWVLLYKKLVQWELKMDQTQHPMREMLSMQKAEANQLFSKFIRKNYENWILEGVGTPKANPGRAVPSFLNSSEEGGRFETNPSQGMGRFATNPFQGTGRLGKDFGKNEGRPFLHNSQNTTGPHPTRPVLSPDLFEQFLFPIVDNGEKLFFILIDNFRFDQWQAVKDTISEHFNYKEDLYFSILPTATPYARNSIFSGLMPNKIAEIFPEAWIDESEEEGKNLHEEKFIKAHLERTGRNYRFSYHKINRNQEGEKLVSRFPELEKNDLNVMVFNFIDLLSHARTESRMIRELAADESAFRSLTRSWFLHSPLPALLEKIAGKGYKVLLTTDHGSIRVKNGVKVLGDKETTANLRYKSGKNLGYDAKKLFDILHPENSGLPAQNRSTRYIFALNNDFFVYPNNYNHYQSYYEDTFQHGGVSMEEMLVPVVTLEARKEVRW